MVKLCLEASGRELGEISDADFQMMQSVLEQEGPDDRDYWIDLDTIELIESRGGSEQLLTLLRNAIAGTPEGAEIAVAG